MPQLLTMKISSKTLLMKVSRILLSIHNYHKLNETSKQCQKEFSNLFQNPTILKLYNQNLSTEGKVTSESQNSSLFFRLRPKFSRLDRNFPAQTEIFRPRLEFPGLNRNFPAQTEIFRLRLKFSGLSPLAFIPSPESRKHSLKNQVCFLDRI